MNVRVVGGILDAADKQRLIEGITDLVIEIEGKGNPDFGQYCWVIVDDIEPGMLGVGGKGLSTEDVTRTGWASAVAWVGGRNALGA